MIKSKNRVVSQFESNCSGLQKNGTHAESFRRGFTESKFSFFGFFRASVAKKNLRRSPLDKMKHYQKQIHPASYPDNEIRKPRFEMEARPGQ